MTTNFQVRVGKRTHTKDPRKFGSRLVDNRSEEWSYCIGDYRLMADSNDKTVTILFLEIGHRREIYK